MGENVPYETTIWGEGESVTSDVMYISLNTLTNHRFAVDALKMVFLTVMNPMAKKKYHTVIEYVKCVTFKMMISSSSIYPPNPSNPSNPSISQHKAQSPCTIGPMRHVFFCAVPSDVQTTDTGFFQAPRSSTLTQGKRNRLSMCFHAG